MPQPLQSLSTSIGMGRASQLPSQMPREFSRVLARASSFITRTTLRVLVHDPKVRVGRVTYLTFDAERMDSQLCHLLPLYETLHVCCEELGHTIVHMCTSTKDIDHLHHTDNHCHWASAAWIFLRSEQVIGVRRRNRQHGKRQGFPSTCSAGAGVSVMPGRQGACHRARLSFQRESTSPAPHVL